MKFKFGQLWKLALAVPLFVALAAVGAGPVMEFYPSHVTFLLDYDKGSYMPQVGDIKDAAVAKACTFGATTGLLGTGGLDEGSVNYNLKDDHTVIDMTKPGTVVFWLKLNHVPDSSSGNEPSGNNFTAQWSTTPNKRWFVFRQSLPWGQGRLATRFETKDADNKDYIIQDYYAASLKNWVPGEWHLCATTHTPTGFGISLDGQPFKNIVSSEPLGPLSKYINFRAFGDCTLDDCAILDFKMSDDQVKQLYDAYQAWLRGESYTVPDPNEGTPSTEATIGLCFAYYPSTNTVHALVDLSGTADTAHATAIRCRILDETTRVEVASASFPPDESGRTDIFWRNVPELDGHYVFRAEVVGIADAAAEQPFVRVRPAWEGNTFGCSGTVPAPFTAIERRNGHVLTVLRDHAIGAFGLWNQVTAVGTNVLARPMALKRNGVTVEESDALSASTEWDVDGLMVWTLTLQPGRQGPLRLEIPIRAERAPLMHVCGDGLRSNYAGEVPAGTGRVWDGSQAWRSKIIGDYVPYLWVGGPLRGIAVFGENDRGWVLSDGVPCQEIVREADGTVVIALNLVASETVVDTPRTIRVGFMATPVKPMLDNWRAIGHGRLLGGNMYYGGVTASLAGFDNTDGFLQVMGEERRTGVFNSEYLVYAVTNYPYAETPGTPEWQEQYDRIYAHYRSGLVTAYSEGHRPDTRLVFYTNARGVYYGDAWGQGATFCNEWCRQEYMGREFRIDSCAYTDNDPVRSFRDYAVWWYERMLATGAADHIYWDNVFCQSSYNLVLSDAYRLPSGVIQPSSGIFNMRALVRRCAVLQAELGKNPRGNWVHMTNTALAPVLAFAGVNYDWEDIADTRTFQQRYSRAYIQACTIGRQFGNRVSIIGYFDKSNPETFAWLVHTGVGVMLTHELRWIDTDHEEYRKVHERLCDWGYRTPAVEVWNYWDEDVAYPLAVDGGECSSIVMAKRNAAEIMVCVSSFENAEKNLTLRPDVAAMGLGAREWTATQVVLSGNELVDAQALEVVDGACSIRLPRYDWALIRIKVLDNGPGTSVKLR